MLPKFYLGSLEITSYSFINGLALPAAILCNLFLLQYKYGLLSGYSQLLLRRAPTWCMRVLAILETVLVTCVMSFLGGQCNSFWAFSLWGGGANYFGLLYLSSPLVILVLLLLRINPLKQLDLYAPSYAVSLAIFKIACHFAGCCEGKECQFGFYNVSVEQYTFPAQLLEMAVALLMFFVLLRMIRKPHIPGTIFPVYMILYSVTRFFTEFTRAGDFIYFGLCAYQIQCLLGIWIGITWLLVTREYGQTLSDRFDRKNQAFVERHSAKQNT